MSRAFVRENDGAEVPEDMPERPVSPHPNFVTARGLKQIETQLRDLERQRDAIKANAEKSELARLDRELRYWLQRKSSARLVEPESAPEKVRFGVRVTVRYDDSTERTYRLVGEDEADPAHGLISWISPIAQSLLGTQVGDEAQLQGRRTEIMHLES